MLSALFVLLLAAGALAAGLGYVRKARSMQAFRSTPGTVIARDVAVVPSGDTTEGRFGDGGGYWPRATYRYVVDGREYTGDRRSYASRGYKRALAEQMAAAIPDTVEVWFNPADPGEAYLERHSATYGWVLVVGGSLAGIGALIVLLAEV